MKRLPPSLPNLLILLTSGFLIAHGPIAQLPHYHEFADQSLFLGVPHAADVLSNLGFLVVAIWGFWKLWPMREHPALKAGWPGYRLFLIGLFFTAFGSSFYHWAPDNTRLIWDRLPIALLCAGLLAGVRAETHPNVNGNTSAAWLAVCALLSVAWWLISEQYGIEDLRPYLFLQAAPLVLIPLWQTIYCTPKADRFKFSTAFVVYIVAKIAEMNDHQLLSILNGMSGHTLKHILATAASGILVYRLIERVR